MERKVFTRHPGGLPAAFVAGFVMVAVIAATVASDGYGALVFGVVVALWGLWIFSRKVELVLDRDSLTTTLGSRSRTISYADIEDVLPGEEPSLIHFTGIAMLADQPDRYAEADAFTLGGPTVRICVRNADDCLIAVADQDHVQRAIRERIGA
ncbi:hypothetical protein QP980_02045 [Corynebacterium coyleae]|uniref:hypothetical protein n=1 Tax=Corynebacterium coyleae TaxID=53374 RepID=UPI00254EA593|nr:hypothetical protein [Corynebacterium coyleae]MDK8822654.1 hypothetical protein [Corynebacterium coyleae]